MASAPARATKLEPDEESSDDEHEECNGARISGNLWGSGVNGNGYHHANGESASSAVKLSQELYQAHVSRVSRIIDANSRMLVAQLVHQIRAFHQEWKDRVEIAFDGHGDEDWTRQDGKNAAKDTCMAEFAARGRRTYRKLDELKLDEHAMVPKSSAKKIGTGDKTEQIRASEANLQTANGWWAKESNMKVVDAVVNEGAKLVDPKKWKKKAVFPDAAEMKKAVRDAMTRHTYNVQDYYHETGICQRVAKSSAFESVTMLLISLNALWIALEVDYNEAESLADADIFFVVVENMFCMYFVGEWLIRFGAFKYKRDCCRDYPFIFDSVLAGLMALETWVMFAWIKLTSMSRQNSGPLGALADASILRLLKLVRLTRMARIVRLLRQFPELIVLIRGIGVAIRSVFFCCTLMFTLTYMFALVLTQLADGTEVGNQYFDTIPDSMKNMLIAACFPDLGDILNDIGFESWLWLFVFLAFIFLISLVALNMVIGVLCEVIKVVSCVEKEELSVRMIKEEMGKILKRYDDGNQMISKEEFMSMLVEPESVQFLVQVGIDAVAMVEYVDVIFKHGKEHTYVDIINLILDLRGSNTCTVKDIVDLRKWIDNEMHDFHCRLMVEFGLKENPLYASEGGSEIKRVVSGGASHSLLPPSGNTVAYTAESMTYWEPIA